MRYCKGNNGRLGWLFNIGLRGIEKMSRFKFVFALFLSVVATGFAAPLLAQDVGIHSGKKLSTDKPTRPYSPYASPYSEYDAGVKYPNRVF